MAESGTVADFRKGIRRLLGVCLLLPFAVSTAHADAPQTFMLQGTILTPAGLPQEATSVAFTIEIRSPGMEDCLLYREAHTLNMANSGGAFSLAIGSGNRTGGGFQETSTLKEVFDNSAANRTGLTCVTGTDYDATSGHTREIAVTFNDGSGPQTLTQVLQVQSVPYALYAENAAKLGGYLPTDLLRVNTLTRALSQSNLESVFFNQARVDELNDLIDGASSQYVGTSSALDFTNNITMSGAGTSLAVTNASTFGGIISANNNTASTSASTGAVVVTGGLGVGGAINSGSTINAATSMRTPIIYGSSAASGTLTLQSTSDVTKGNILINPNGGNVGIGTATPGARLDVSAAGYNFRYDGSVSYVTSSGNSMTRLYNTFDAGINGDLSGTIQFGPGNASSWDTTLYRNSTGVLRTPGSLVADGNVGIGTTAPTAKLEVNQSLDGGIGIRVNNPSTATNAYSELAFFQGATRMFTIGQVNDNAGTPYVGGQSAIQLWNYANGPMVMATNSIERMRIDAGGNVGIGTASPNSKLSFGTATGDLIHLYDGGPGARHGIGIAVNETQLYVPATGHFSFNSGGNLQATGTNEVVRITATGNVGIGTASPGASLDVNGAMRLRGATSGYVELAAPAVAGSSTIRLPAGAGTAGQAMVSNASSELQWVAVPTLNVVNRYSGFSSLNGVQDFTLVPTAPTGLYRFTVFAKNTVVASSGAGCSMNIRYGFASDIGTFTVSTLAPNINGTSGLFLSNSYTAYHSDATHPLVFQVQRTPGTCVGDDYRFDIVVELIKQF